MTYEIIHPNRKTKNIAGKTFGMLTVIAPVKRTRSIWWLCICDCGTDCLATTNNITSGHTKSCGCFHATHAKTHGKYGTPEYRIWGAMIQRCTNPANPRFAYYGGRGIQTCDRWLGSFECFFADMGERPEQNPSLDRIDNNGSYTPNNCRWSDRKTQARNKQNTRVISHGGETLPVVEWSEITGINYNTLIDRMNRGWGAERVLSPVRPHR